MAVAPLSLPAFVHPYRYPKMEYNALKRRRSKKVNEPSGRKLEVLSSKEKKLQKRAVSSSFFFETIDSFASFLFFETPFFKTALTEFSFPYQQQLSLVVVRYRMSAHVYAFSHILISRGVAPGENPPFSLCHFIFYPGYDARKEAYAEEKKEIYM